MSAGEKLLGTPEPRHLWTGAGGIRLAGDSWGDPEAPLVVLQHGGGQTRHAWKGAGERLASAGYYAVAFDARGHGDSDWSPDGRYDQDIMVEDLKCLLATFGSRRPALVGASMGGGTSLVRGGISDVLTEDGAREFLRLCPHCKYVSVADAAHMVAGDRNDVFGNAAIAFLSRVVPVGGTPVHPPHELHPHREGPAGEVQYIP